MAIIRATRHRLGQVVGAAPASTWSSPTAFGLIVALPRLWGLLSYITNYTPNIGSVLGLVPLPFPLRSWPCSRAGCGRRFSPSSPTR